MENKNKLNTLMLCKTIKVKRPFRSQNDLDNQRFEKPLFQLQKRKHEGCEKKNGLCWKD